MAAPTRRTVGPQIHMAAVCNTRLMPKVAKMVVSGSLPISERRALRCMNSPKDEDAQRRGGQAQPESCRSW